MAKKVITSEELTDDIDGSKAEATVRLSIDGDTYELELSRKNRTALDKALKPYIDAARRVRGNRGRKAAATTGTSSRRSELASIRAWATEQGLEISERGRISKDIQEQYAAAH